VGGASLRSLGTPIARGMTAEVYAWDETRILELFRPGCVEHEAHIARVVHARWTPCPTATGCATVISGASPLLSWPQRVIARRVHAAYLRRYFQLRPEDREQCVASSAPWCWKISTA